LERVRRDVKILRQLGERFAAHLDDGDGRYFQRRRIEKLGFVHDGILPEAGMDKRPPQCLYLV
ncbi:MAG: hypothetical protein B7Z49_00930, partial [Hydrogenophilales bacterium 12-63-5]